jgi:cell division transport system permease protein
MAANRPTIEVLHFVGAENRFIAKHFQEHFLWLGMRGGAIGGGSAVVVLLLVQLIAAWTPDAGGGNPLYALFGSFSLGMSGYAAVLAQVVLVAAATAITARQTVNRTLQAIP